MTHKLTEEQQRAAHKIIVANRGDCKKKGNYLNCPDCASFYNDACPVNVSNSLPYFFAENLRRSQKWLDAHPATPQEPAKRRPTPAEMFVGATVRVRLWEELVKDNLTFHGKEDLVFVDSMKKYCGNTYKIIKCLSNPFLVCLENCYNDFGFGGHWFFTPEMLDYVEPEMVAQPKAKEPVAKAPTEGLRVLDLERQVNDLTKKLAASERKCKRLARRLRAKWEAARNGEMATREELKAWFDDDKGSIIIDGKESKIKLNGCSTWIPATRGNLKL